MNRFESLGQAAFPVSAAFAIGHWNLVILPPSL